MYVGAVSSTSLDLKRPLSPGEPAQAYMAGGFVPEGQRFVITRIEYEARPMAGEKSAARIAIRLGEMPLVEVQLADGAVKSVWTGAVAVERLDEREFALEANYVIGARAVLEGHCEPSERR